MNPARWQQIESLYHSALEQPNESRASYLDRVCGNDPDLRRELESLLARDGSDGGIFDRHAFEHQAWIDEFANDELKPEKGNALQPGMQLGVYRITDTLGAGGMGEVYRARDTRLDRDVAIKVLPSAFAGDSDRLARFEREAKTLASLNHPNIAQIYGVDDSAGMPALAMELVSGAPICGPLPVDTVLAYIRQIASALDAAHRRGIVHRDLKPANIIVTPDGVVKLLDFGLARPVADESDDLDRSGTRSGIILGTAGYMAPEQARGKALDKRADIWAFGVLVYEISTGKRLFSGETLADILASVLTKDPDLEGAPAQFRRLIRSCLQRDPNNRMGDIADWAGLLDEVSTPAATHAPANAKAPRVWTPVATGAALALVMLLGAGYFYSSHTKSPVTSPSEYVQITSFADSASAPSLSPDGRMVTFLRGENFFLNRNQVYVKLLPNGEARQISNDPNQKYGPVFTPDGSRVAFTSSPGNHWDTWTVPVLGGEPVRFLPNAAGLTWMRDGRILFSEIMEGTPMHMGIVAAAESRAGERTIYFPEHERAMAHFASASPDLKSVLVVEMNRNTAWQRCRLLPMDGTSSGRQVGPAGECTATGWSPDGTWMYFTGSTEESSGVVCPCQPDGISHLWRQRASGGEAEQITFGPTEEQGVAVAPDGHSLISTVGIRQSAVWTHGPKGDRSLDLEGYAYRPRLSDDAQRVYYLNRPASSSLSELRSTDLSTGKTVNVLPGALIDEYEVSHDEKEVLYSTKSAGESQLWLAALDRHSPPRLVVRAADEGSFGAPGEFVIRSLEAKQNFLYRIKADGTGRERMANMPVFYKQGVSPDGEWVIADTSNGETLAFPLRGGNPETICSFTCRAWWSSDGKLFYATVLAASSNSNGRTLAIPLRPGKMLPDLGASGITSAASQPDIPGTKVLYRGDDVRGTNDPSVYVFTRREFRGNLFRIPLH